METQQVFLITEQMIREVDKVVPAIIPSVPRIMKIHQIKIQLEYTVQRGVAEAD